MNNNKITQAVKILHEGGIIAYPTEGVFGLGCDPFNETAVLRLLKIKKRDVKKGLILIAADWKQVKNLINWRKLPQKTSTPTTWIFPSTRKVPVWISGTFRSVAIRVTTHRTAKELCQRFGGPIVSTSANLSGELILNSSEEINKQFSSLIDFVVPGKIGNLKKPTSICDIKTKKIIRI